MKSGTEKQKDGKESQRHWTNSRTSNKTNAEGRKYGKFSVAFS